MTSICCGRREDRVALQHWPEDSGFDVKVRPTGFRHLKTTHARVVCIVTDALCLSNEAMDGEIFIRASFYLRDRIGGTAYKIQNEPVRVYGRFGRRWRLLTDKVSTDQDGELGAVLPASAFPTASVTPLAVVLDGDGTVGRLALWRLTPGTQAIVVDLEAVFIDHAAAELANISPTFTPAPVAHSVATITEWANRGFAVVYIAPGRDASFTAATVRTMRHARLPPGPVLLSPSSSVPSPTVDQLPSSLSIVRAFLPDDGSGAPVPMFPGAAEAIALIPTTNKLAAELHWGEHLASVQHSVDVATEPGPRYVPPRAAWFHIL